MKINMVIAGLCGLLVYWIYSMSAPAMIKNTFTEEKILHIEPESGTTWLTEQLDDAARSIDITMYQFSDQSVAAHMVAAAKRGVQVKVLLNHGYRGQGSPDNEAAYEYLVDRGVETKWTPGCFDLTHEKSVLIDDQLLDVMTLNLTPKYYASGREFAVVDRDASDLVAARVAFTSDWNGRCRQDLPKSHLVWSPGAKAATLELITTAQTSVAVYNEEMADADVTRALEAAAERGVRVEICMTYTTSWKRAFNELADHGVVVHTYASSAGRYIHAKMILADNERSFIGSQNFSEPSLNSNRELGIIVTDRPILAQLRSTFDQDFAEARPYARR